MGVAAHRQTPVRTGVRIDEYADLPLAHGFGTYALVCSVRYKEGCGKSSDLSTVDRIHGIQRRAFLRLHVIDLRRCFFVCGGCRVRADPHQQCGGGIGFCLLFRAFDGLLSGLHRCNMPDPLRVLHCIVQQDGKDRWYWKILPESGRNGLMRRHCIFCRNEDQCARKTHFPRPVRRRGIDHSGCHPA